MHSQEAGAVVQIDHDTLLFGYKTDMLPMRVFFVERSWFCATLCWRQRVFISIFNVVMVCFGALSVARGCDADSDALQQVAFLSRVLPNIPLKEVNKRLSPQESEVLFGDEALRDFASEDKKIRISFCLENSERRTFYVHPEAGPYVGMCLGDESGFVLRDLNWYEAARLAFLRSVMRNSDGVVTHRKPFHSPEMALLVASFTQDRRRDPALIPFFYGRFEMPLEIERHWFVRQRQPRFEISPGHVHVSIGDMVLNGSILSFDMQDTYGRIHNDGSAFFNAIDRLKKITKNEWTVWS